MSYRKRLKKDSKTGVENGQYQLSGRFRLAARIIGFGMIGFGGAMLIGEAVSALRKGDFVQPELAGVLLVVISLVALADLILSWRWEKPAGVMLGMCCCYGCPYRYLCRQETCSGLGNGGTTVSGLRRALH